MYHSHNCLLLISIDAVDLCIASMEDEKSVELTLWSRLSYLTPRSNLARRPTQENMTRRSSDVASLTIVEPIYVICLYTHSVRPM